MEWLDLTFLAPPFPLLRCLIVLRVFSTLLIPVPRPSSVTVPPRHARSASQGGNHTMPANLAALIQASKASPNKLAGASIIEGYGAYSYPHGVLGRNCSGTSSSLK